MKEEIVNAPPRKKKVGFARFNSDDFLLLGLSMSAKKEEKMDNLVSLRKFRTLFGTSPNICSIVWNMVYPSSNIALKRAKPQHLLWALMLLKTYSEESVMSCLAGGVDEKTFRKWAWIFIQEIESLFAEVVSGYMNFIFTFNFFC